MLNVIKKEWNVFIEYTKLQLMAYLEYPLNFLVGFVWTCVALIPMYFFWNALLTSGVDINYNQTTIILYYLFTIGFFYSGGFFKSLRQEIIKGTIVTTLVRKIRLENYFVYNAIATVLISRFLIGIVIVIAGIYFVGLQSLLGVLFFIFGLIIGATIYSILIAIGFWTGESWGYFYVTSIIINLVGGSIIPLDLFPIFWQKIIAYTPFSLMFYVPAKIYLGELTITPWLIFAYVAWAVVLYLILNKMISLGLKRFEQLGG